jgi:hypothetical protein
MEAHSFLQKKKNNFLRFKNILLCRKIFSFDFLSLFIKNKKKKNEKKLSSILFRNGEVRFNQTGQQSSEALH